jgi:hypothetical protein
VDCPSIAFDGTITATGDGIVLYQWERSDGTSGPQQTLTFLSSNTLPVTQELLAFDDGSDISGWVRLKVLAPTLVDSDQIMFEMDCGVE